MVGDKWFIKKEDGVFGPVSVDDLQNLIKNGRITLDQEASQNETGPWEPLKSYDLFKERPRPIEEMFEDEDTRVPDENTEAPTFNDYVRESMQKDAILVLAKNQFRHIAWGIFWGSIVAAFLYGKVYTQFTVGHNLFCALVLGISLRSIYYYFMVQKLGKLPQETLRKMWFDLGGFAEK